MILSNRCDEDVFGVKINDKVICVNNFRNVKNNRSSRLENLTFGKVYIVLDKKHMLNNVTNQVKFIKIIGDTGKKCWVTTKRFIANEEYVTNYIRRDVLNDILNDDNINL